jgi:hypothetical protein
VASSRRRSCCPEVTATMPLPTALPITAFGRGVVQIGANVWGS